jgi:hypothetical protein
MCQASSVKLNATNDRNTSSYAREFGFAGLDLGLLTGSNKRASVTAFQHPITSYG